MQYKMPANSTMFVRVSKKAIKKDYVIQISMHNFENFKSNQALYLSTVCKKTTFAELQQYLLSLCKRYNYANYYIVNAHKVVTLLPQI
jgi:5'(3')-deoxyribonucleotidase